MFDKDATVDLSKDISEQPANIQNIMKALPLKQFNEWVKLQTRNNFLTYQGFMNAMVKAPRFCNATLGGPVGKIGVEAMCRKELAAFSAMFCSKYNGNNSEVSSILQCFNNYDSPEGCDLPENIDSEKC
jgi:hypothetical protein